MKAGDVLRFAATRKITLQYKKYLDLLADLKADSEAQTNRLKDALSVIEYSLKQEGKHVPLLIHLKQSDWFDEEKLKRLRKQVLDFGNDLNRELELEFNNYEINIKKHESES